jgi:hypothetical protein
VSWSPIDYWRHANPWADPLLRMSAWMGYLGNVPAKPRTWSAARASLLRWP